MALTTATAASAPFVYVMATFAPSAPSRLAIAAPMPREPPVRSAIFPSNFFDIVHLLELDICSSGMSPSLIARPRHPNHYIGLPSSPVVAHLKHTLLGLVAMLHKHGSWKWNYDTCVISLRSPKPRV